MTDPAMKLPGGKTCKDCCFFKHCASLYSVRETDTHCDFHPVRFSPIPEVYADAGDHEPMPQGDALEGFLPVQVCVDATCGDCWKCSCQREYLRAEAAQPQGDALDKLLLRGDIYAFGFKQRDGRNKFVINQGTISGNGETSTDAVIALLNKQPLRY